MFAIREKSLKLLVSTNIDSNSRILENRNVVKRVRYIFPHIKYEDDPYCVAANGKLYWIVDAFTTSRHYPYSEPYSGLVGGDNYVKNSIKVVVDAYDGTVDYYVVDDSDPIAKTLQKVYPKLFKNGSEMPEDLKDVGEAPEEEDETNWDDVMYYTKYKDVIDAYREYADDRMTDKGIVAFDNSAQFYFPYDSLEERAVAFNAIQAKAIALAKGEIKNFDSYLITCLKNDWKNA